MNHLDHLQKIAANAKVFGYSARVSLNYIEPDKRTHPRIRRELLDTGYVAEFGDILEVKVDDVLATIQPEVVNLWEEWKANREGGGGYKPQADLPFVRIGWTRSPGWLMGMYEDPDMEYVVISRYENERITEKDIHGPYKSTAEAIENQRKLGSNYEIGVTKPVLREMVENTLFQERVERTAKQNLHWWLVESGVLAGKEDAEHIPENFIAPGGFGHKGDPTLHRPEHWATSCNKLIDDTIQQMVQLANRLRVLNHVKNRVDAIGWDQWISDYYAKIVEELKKEAEDG